MVDYTFHGKPAHAAGNPDKGRSALDGVEAMNYMVNLMREHIPTESRIHYVISNGGEAPNVVPEEATVSYYIRHPKREVLIDLVEWVNAAAEGAAKGTQTTVTREVVAGFYERLPNRKLAEVVQKHLETVGGVHYNDRERAFAEALVQHMGLKADVLKEAAAVQPLAEERPSAGGGSSDVGDVSWNVPTVSFGTATFIPGSPGHSWQNVAAGGTTIGTKSLINTAKVFALTAIDLMDQSWWFPAFAPLPGQPPKVMLAERSLPGSFIVDETGARFVNEACDYMSFGQRILERERAGNPVDEMWMVFDQKYRNSYVMAAELFPRMPIPQSWYDAGIAHTATSFGELARKMGVDENTFTATARRFNESAVAGMDLDFQRGASAYDRYYGDPTVTPNPNLRPLDKGPFFAVKLVLSDLGTCGGLRADENARVLREDGSAVDGLYAIGNTAANVFGATYPGAGATIAQGLVYGYIAAAHAAG